MPLGEEKSIWPQRATALILNRSAGLFLGLQLANPIPHGCANLRTQRPPSSVLANESAHLPEASWPQPPCQARDGSIFWGYELWALNTE